MIFVDTSAWFASAVDEDINHSAASQWLEQNGDTLITSDYVVETFSDKEWSFTDCTSRVLMEKLRIERAFAFDQHFLQFGGVKVVP